MSEQCGLQIGRSRLAQRQEPLASFALKRRQYDYGLAFVSHRDVPDVDKLTGGYRFHIQ